MSQARRWVVIGSASLVLLAGCTDQPAAAAATVGSVQIGLQDVTDQLQAINEVLGAPIDAADVQQTNSIVRNNVVYQIVQQGADAAGVTVTPTQVAERLADQIEFVGSQSMLEQQAARAGVAPAMIETDIRVSLLAEGWAAELAPGPDVADEALQEFLVAEVQRYSEEADTTVNPRFGAWDVTTLSVVADPSAPSALGAPDDLGLIGQQ